MGWSERRGEPGHLRLCVGWEGKVSGEIYNYPSIVSVVIGNGD